MSRFLSHAARAPFVTAMSDLVGKFISGEIALDVRIGRNGPVPSSADGIGGRGRRTLRRLVWEAANGHCAHCRQITRLDVAADACDAATLTLLVPASIIGASSDRLGYIAGNIGHMCRTCVNLSNDTNRHPDAFVWMPDMYDCETVLQTWPSLPRMSVSPKFASTADPFEHLSECLRVAAARGITL